MAARAGGALGDRSELAEIHTTIDRNVQRAAESAVSSTIATLAEKHVTAASVIVLDNATGNVVAWVGSPDFENAALLGQNDGVIALRQPGSSLKPFVYAEAMATLGYTGATMLPDVEIHIPLPNGGDYVPHDYDAKLRGRFACAKRSAIRSTSPRSPRSASSGRSACSIASTRSASCRSPKRP